VDSSPASSSATSTFSPSARTPSTASTGTRRTLLPIRTSTPKPSRTRTTIFSLPSGRFDHVSKRVVSRATIRDTVLFERPCLPTSGRSTALTFLVFTPPRYMPITAWSTSRVLRA
jgi:hypothetical protein